MTVHVYFIRSGRRGSIKIGVAENIDKRICEMQTGNPFELMLVASMEFKSRKHAMDVESKLHKKFRKYHVRGEWFRPSIKLSKIDNIWKKGGHKVSELVKHNPVYESANDKIKRLEREVKMLETKIQDMNDENEDLMEVINSRY